MKIGKVIGHVVSTKKDERLVGFKLLIVQVLYPTEEGQLGVGDDKYHVAVDLVGAGREELVLICSGSSARLSASGDNSAPVDEAIVGIIDPANFHLQG